MDWSSGWNFPACFAYPAEVSAGTDASKCCAQGWRRLRCGECLLQLHKTMRYLGGFARGYCPCGEPCLAIGINLLPSQQATQFDAIFRDASPFVPKCMALKIFEFATDENVLSRLDHGSYKKLSTLLPIEVKAQAIFSRISSISGLVQLISLHSARPRTCTNLRLVD